VKKSLSAAMQKVAATQSLKRACIHRQHLVPGVTTWRTWQNITLSLILPHWLHYVKTWCCTQNLK